MEPLRAKLPTDIILQCPGRAVAKFALVLIVCVVYAISEEDDVPPFTDVPDIDASSLYVSDVTYYPLSDKTPPADSDSSWIDGIADTDVTSPSNSRFSQSSLRPWRSAPSDFDASVPSVTTAGEEKTNPHSTTTFSYVTVTTSDQLSSQKLTSQTNVILNSTASSKTSSSVTNPLTSSPTMYTSTTTQTHTPTNVVTTDLSSVPSMSPMSAVNVTYMSSMSPSDVTYISSLSSAGITPPSLSVSTELSVLTSTSLSPTTQFLSSTSPTAPVASSRFCNRTVASSYYTACEPCYMPPSCKAGDTIVFSERCRSSFGMFRRCRRQCLHTSTVADCCQGYWGGNCDECPGGHDSACNGHGECQSSNGTCICKAGFTGTACELCEDRTKYGLDCSHECSCVHGTCNNGVYGDGSCACESGYKGENCDTENLECNSLSCHSEKLQNWRCADVNGTATCVCAVGYGYTPDLSNCTARNPCNDSITRCGKNSRCEYTGPGQHKCTCEDGYAGDGFVCIPIDPCQTNGGGCGDNTTCKHTGPNQRVCLCKFGYENYIPDTGCSLIDTCNTSTCNINAICQMVQPYTFKCTCKEGYVGSGIFCYGNILERIKEINNNNPNFHQDLLYAINLITKFYAEPLTKHGPFTLFVPNDRAFRDVIRANKGFEKFLDDEDRSMQILRQHILIGQFKLDDLQSFDSFYTLQGNAAQLQIRVAKNVFRYKLQGGSDRAKIIGKDFIASNGIIHIVNNLLTLEPEISGDKTKTAMDLIKLEGTYNRFQTLIISAGVSDVFTQPNITVFAPENRAWDALPSGTLEYLMNDDVGREKLKVILKNHVFPGVIGVTDLISTSYIKSLANVEVKVTISTLGQIQLDGKVNVSQVNIPCSTGLYHHVEGIIIPSYIEELLPNRCAEILIKEVRGPCARCTSQTPTCLKETDVLTSKRSRCDLFGLLCSWVCNREVKIPKCCPGFYGSDCIPCPGGYRIPCNGNGQCADGLTGSGLCFCEGDFIGTACDRCRQKDVFGPNCNETCTCLYGQCDEGPKGTGVCKEGSCQLGYQGENCDQKLVMCHGNPILCHAHAKCYLNDSNIARCQCERGYEEDGEDCKEIDPCLGDDNGGCHQQATCTKVGPGAKWCECNNGWIGDGFYCSPKTPCKDHTDCNVNAKCYNSEPGRYHCVCKTGYRGDGKTCDLVNLCLENNGGCHPRAICTPLKVGERNCTCPENLVGDGFMCVGSIADEVMMHPNLTRLASLLKNLSKPNNLLDNVEDKMTLFAPSDSAMEAFMAWFSTWNRTSYWQDEMNILWFINFHTIYNSYSTEDLIALDGILKSFPTMYDGFSIRIVKVNDILRILVNHSEFAVVSQPSILSRNGQIHIIDKVLEPFLPTDQVPTLNETLASQSQYQLFYEAMQVTGILDQLKDMDEYTVFVPTNDAIRQLNRTVNAEFIKYYIVRQLLFTPSIFDNDSFETLLGAQHKLLMTVSQNTVKVNGVQISRSDILFDGGVMHVLDGVLHPVLNRCDFNSTEMNISDCGDCTNQKLTCPMDYFPLNPPRIIKYECSFVRYPDAGWKTIGCQQICTKNITKLECCGGYFGPFCKECPGGAENPCSGNGRCSAGLAGNGTCSCGRGFSGSDCGKCEDSNMAPPHCNFTYNSCGYRNGNCSEHAVCNETSSGVSCRCSLGYVGDGYTCRSQCEILDNGGCHPQASCIFNVTKLAVQCTCKQGFHGNGMWCQQNINPCALDNGGCDHDRASCSFIAPKVTDMFEGTAKCDCKKGYIGNGKICSTDLKDAISRIPELRYLYAWLMENDMLRSTNVSQMLSDNKARSTVFLPVNTEWQTLDLTSLVVEGVVFRLPIYPGTEGSVDEHSTDGHIIGQLETLSGEVINVTVNDKKQFFANNVRIVQPNIETFNGVLHLTEWPIVTSENVKLAASRDKGGSNSTVVIACVVAAVVIVILVALVGAVIYIKKHHEGFFNIFKSSQSNSESNISFARLSAQEEEDDAFKTPDNARYDNPIFNDPDLL